MFVRKRIRKHDDLVLQRETVQRRHDQFTFRTVALPQEHVQQQEVHLSHQLLLVLQLQLVLLQQVAQLVVSYIILLPYATCHTMHYF